MSAERGALCPSLVAALLAVGVVASFLAPADALAADCPDPQLRQAIAYAEAQVATLRQAYDTNPPTDPQVNAIVRQQIADAEAGLAQLRDQCVQVAPRPQRSTSPRESTAPRLTTLPPFVPITFRPIPFVLRTPSRPFRTFRPPVRPRLNQAPSRPNDDPRTRGIPLARMKPLRPADLYRDSKIDDQRAAAIYADALRARLADLRQQRVAALGSLADLDRREAAFAKALTAQDLASVKKALTDARADAARARDVEIQSAIEIPLGVAFPAVGASTLARDAAYLGLSERLRTQEGRSFAAADLAQYANVAAGLVGYVPGYGAGLQIAQELVSQTFAYAWDQQAKTLEQAAAGVQSSVEAYRGSLRLGKMLAQARLDEAERQIAARQAELRLLEPFRP